MPPIRRSWALTFVLAILSGCEKPLPSAVFREATDVVVSTPVDREVTDYEEFTGRTDAFRMVEVRARVTGYLQKRLFREGEEVKEGDLLYEIDDRPYKAALDLAESNVAKAEAHRKRLDSDHRRSSNLFQRGAIGKAEFDIVTSDFAEAGAMLNAAKAQVDAARLDFDFTKIRAPMSGQISQSLVEPGNLVRQQTTLLTDIVDADQLFVYFDLNQDTLTKVKDLIRDGRVLTTDGKEVPVRIGLSDEENYSYKGLVNFSENKVDAATGTLRIRGIMENPQPRILSPGLFVRVRLPIGSRYLAHLVPEEAVGSDQGRRFVYVVDPEDTVIYKPVEVGLAFSGLRSIVSGLESHERIIVAGLQRVRPGTRVSPKEAIAAKKAATPPARTSQ